MESSFSRLSGFRAWLFGAVAILAFGFVASLVLPHELVCRSQGPRGLDWLSLDGADLTLYVRPSCTGPLHLVVEPDGAIGWWAFEGGRLVSKSNSRGWLRTEREGRLVYEVDDRPPEHFGCWPDESAWSPELRKYESVADSLFVLGWGSAILLGLGLGAAFSLLEAWSARALARPRLVTSWALTVRVSATWGLAAFCALGREWGEPLPARGVGVAAALVFGQLLAASIVALRASDVRGGWIQGAPSHLVTLLLSCWSVVALPIAGFLAHSSWAPDEPLPVFLLLVWTPLWVALPVVLHASLPGFLKVRVRRAGLAVGLFALAQLVPGERAARMTHVIDGVRLWTRHAFALEFEFVDETRGALGIGWLVGAALVVALAALVLDVRRERRQKAA